MPCANPDLMWIEQQIAKAVETAIAQSHIGCTEAVALAGACADAEYLRVGSGVACFSGRESAWSQVIGWGFDEVESGVDQSIIKLEAFFRSHEMDVCPIELSPLTGAWLPSALGRHGYRLTECSTISVLALKDAPRFDHEPSHDVQVEEVRGAAAVRRWAELVARGLESEETTELCELYARGRGMYAFIASIDGSPCGGGTIGIHDGVCDLGLTSVLPEYRSRGAQKALLLTRLAFAFRQGARLASVTTEPGSISDLNVQKVGFRVAYTRVKLEKRLNQAFRE